MMLSEEAPVNIQYFAIALMLCGQFARFSQFDRIRRFCWRLRLDNLLLKWFLLRYGSLLASWDDHLFQSQLQKGHKPQTRNPLSSILRQRTSARPKV